MDQRVFWWIFDAVALAFVAWDIITREGATWISVVMWILIGTVIVRSFYLRATDRQARSAA